MHFRLWFSDWPIPGEVHGKTSTPGDVCFNPEKDKFGFNLIQVVPQTIQHVTTIFEDKEGQP